MTAGAAQATGDAAPSGAGDDPPIDLLAGYGPLRLIVLVGIVSLLGFSLSQLVFSQPVVAVVVVSLDIQVTEQASEPWELWIEVPWFNETQSSGTHPLLARVVRDAAELRWKTRDGSHHLVIAGTGPLNLSLRAESEDLDQFWWTDRDTRSHALSVQLISPEDIDVLVFLEAAVDAPPGCEEGRAQNRVAFNSYPITATATQAIWQADLCVTT